MLAPRDINQFHHALNRRLANRPRVSANRQRMALRQQPPPEPRIDELREMIRRRRLVPRWRQGPQIAQKHFHRLTETDAVRRMQQPRTLDRPIAHERVIRRVQNHAILCRQADAMQRASFRAAMVPANQQIYVAINQPLAQRLYLRRLQAK